MNVLQLTLIVYIIAMTALHLRQNSDLLMQTIKETTFRELWSTGTVRSVGLAGKRGGYAIVIKLAADDRMLANTRGEIRLFSLGAAAKFLREIGLLEFCVNMHGFEPGRLRGARPDRAAALRKTRSTPVQAMLL